MTRKLLVDQVSFGGVALPGSTEVRVTWRRLGTGETDWSAAVTLPGLLRLPESGRFVARAATGAVAGEATARVTVDGDGPTLRTSVLWQGTGELTLPE